MEKTNVVQVFLDVEAHRLTADIIRKFSTNKKTSGISTWNWEEKENGQDSISVKH